MTLVWTLTDAFLLIGVGAPIDAEMIQEIQTAVDTANGTTVATSTTNGAAGRTLTIADQGGTAYQVLVTFQTAAPGNIGEWSVVNTSATECIVYNTGNIGVSFSYKAVK